MSLPAHQERILHGIESALRTCEPRLASRFAIFTRLTKDEDLPPREQVVPQAWPKRVAAAWRGSPHGARPGGGAPAAARGRTMAGFRAAVLLPVVLIAMASALVAASLTASHACTAAASRASVVTGRWDTCRISGAPAHGTRTAGPSAQGTPR
jgi:hypothetical protein